MEIPEHFICPISLQIMKEPVTATSGITYDRESIQRWLFIKSNNNTTICPVTMQPLPHGISDLTPNHNLRRLIQSWCETNGLDHPIPAPVRTPPQPTKLHVIIDLTKSLSHDHTDTDTDIETKIKTLQRLEALAAQGERNRAIMCEAGLANSLLSFITSCHKRRSTRGLEEALSLFYLVSNLLLCRPDPCRAEEILEPLLWILSGDCFCSHAHVAVKPHAAYLLRVFVQKASTTVLGKLKPEFFETVFSNLRPEKSLSQQGIISLLHVLLDTCPWGRNRVIMVQLGAVLDLIEVEIRSEEKKTTELVLGILCHLCSCAEGRAQLVNHAAGISAVTRRILKVSPVVDDSAVFIIWLVSRYSGTNAVLQEMLRAGTVDKLCMVMQANCDTHLKERAKEILRAHSDVWRGARLVLKLIP